MQRPALLVTLLLALAACGKPAPGPIPHGTVAEWPAYGATPGGTHFTRADQITPGNVTHLQQVWQHQSGDLREASREPWASQSSLEVTPIVIDERLYYCSPFNKLFALNAATGEELWRFDAEVDAAAERALPNCRGVSSWRSGAEGFCEHRIVMGTLDARLVAVDAQSGKPCPDFGEDGAVDVTHGLSEHAPHEYSITSPPAILGDRVITGAMVLDNVRLDVPSGVVRAYHARTGELLWAWNPVPPGSQTHNADGTFLSGSANVWSIIAVDETRNLVFVPTGNTSPDYYGGQREGLDHFSSSVVALDGATGEVVWHQQLVHHDVWDYDTPAQPTLVDMTVDGTTVPAVVQVTKMGMTFAFHRETGAPLWPIEERPVPAGGVGDENLSPTQPFPTHIPHLFERPLNADDAWGLTFWDEGACRDLLAGMDNEGFYTPPSTRGAVNHPSNGGGNNWGSPAIHPDKRIMVVYTIRAPGSTRLVPREQCGERSNQQGTPYCVRTGFVNSPLGVPCTPPPWGTLDAIDLQAGKILWSVPMGTTRNMAPFPFWWIEGLPGFAGPMMTASGLVFSGISNEHALRAFDLATGAELWKGALPTAGNAVPMSYQLESTGRQYVVIAAGGHWSGGSPPGDYLIAFALPDEA